MDYHALKSIAMATKAPHSFQGEIPSFRVERSAFVRFIEPSFEKIVFESERPQVLLISAVGATGKTTLARQLSYETELPLLDLSSHKPVADNTLSGLVTNSFDVKNISAVLASIGAGTYGIIIDGLDEGRSKTTEKAYEAFLDDLARMCASAANVSFILLGRAQTVEESWLYLDQKGIRSALLSISPFGLQAAKRYIDSISGVQKGSAHEDEYNKARDLIVDRLSKAFRDDNRLPTDFLSFIGYPPVLDAIGTLLKDEPNYFKLAEDLAKSERDQNEIALLLTVTNRILLREKNEKVIPNVVNSLVEDHPAAERTDIIGRIFSPEEQCLRILHAVLDVRLRYQVIPDKVLNDKYESALKQWLPEHPFLINGKIRNAVFEALVMSIVLDKWGAEYAEQVSEFASRSKGNYHVIYMFDQLSKAKEVPIPCLGTFVDAAMEFNTRTSSVQLAIVGPSVDDLLEGDEPSPPTKTRKSNIEIDVQINFQDESTTGYSFSSTVSESTTIRIRSGLQSTSITVPCGIELSSAAELHLSAPVEIHCDLLHLRAPHLLLTAPGKNEYSDVLLDCSTLDSSVEKLTTNGIAFNITVNDKTTLSYPLATYAAKRRERARNKDQEQKYLRLKRIVVEFRSHSRGRLARLRAKIESARVLKNATGDAILRKLIADGVLTPEGSHYFINPDAMSQKLGISWVDLRRGMTTEKLDRYLFSIR